MTNNIVAYVQGHYAAYTHEQEIGRKLTPMELRDFVVAYMQNVEAVNTEDIRDNR